MSEKNVKDLGFQTRAVHTGNGVDGETGAIKRPITMANSYELPYDPSDLNWNSALFSCAMSAIAFMSEIVSVGLPGVSI